MNLQGTTLYAVHGWKIEEPLLGKCIINLAPEVIEIGMRLVFPKDQKYGFFGEILARMDVNESVTSQSFAVPDAATTKRLAHGLKLMGLEKMSTDGPLLWLVVG